MYPIKLSHISTEFKTSTYRFVEYPLLSSLQLQIDSTVSFANQLLREFHILLINMEKLTVQHGELQLSNTVNLDKQNDELLLELRSQWSTLSHRLDNLEITIRCAIKTLQNSLETAFLCEEYLKTTNITSYYHSPDEMITAYAGLTLNTIEKEFSNLECKRKDLVKIWSTQIAENIKQSSNS
ncbi:hypothetical protein EWB00_007290 [Schistosoma japonicum]|uniref:Uncharacterized protein n=1 Tax=Schistosoma japonicum TaxID=6182 RepID=A0A4Z2CV46_SCHJA|nr:hypothetical protein EWB00_007290 [Schistosoma japonicum]